jgi:hypothetical protein
VQFRLLKLGVDPVKEGGIAHAIPGFFISGNKKQIMQLIRSFLKKHPIDMPTRVARNINSQKMTLLDYAVKYAKPTVAKWLMEHGARPSASQFGHSVHTMWHGSNDNSDYTNISSTYRTTVRDIINTLKLFSEREIHLRDKNGFNIIDRAVRAIRYSSYFNNERIVSHTEKISVVNKIMETLNIRPASSQTLVTFFAGLDFYEVASMGLREIQKFIELQGTPSTNGKIADVREANEYDVSIGSNALSVLIRKIEFVHLYEAKINAGLKRIITTLVRSGTNPNARDDNGETALHALVRNVIESTREVRNGGYNIARLSKMIGKQSVKMAKLLEEVFINPFIKNKQGQTAYDLSEDGTELKKYLADFMKKLKSRGLARAGMNKLPDNVIQNILKRAKLSKIGSTTLENGSRPSKRQREINLNKSTSTLIKMRKIQ